MPPKTGTPLPGQLRKDRSLWGGCLGATVGAFAGPAFTTALIALERAQPNTFTEPIAYWYIGLPAVPIGAIIGSIIGVLCGLWSARRSSPRDR